MGNSLIGRLSGKYKHASAWLFFALFYAELATPLLVRANHYSLPDNASFGYVNLSTPMVSHDDKGISKNTSGINAKAPVTKTIKTEAFQKPFIGGPGQPEMSSFQSVNGNNMVDLFTGDFSYNIPLMDVGGYPLNIHYSSGVTMDQEASWVGLGWNINPGAINRNMRGLPDDFNGMDSITKTQNMKINRTIGAAVAGDAEFFGKKVLKVTAKLGVFKNNYNGWGVESGLNAAVSLSLKSKGELNSSGLTLGVGYSNNSQTGLSISPSLTVSLKKNDNAESSSASNMGISTGYHSRSGISGLTFNSSQYRPNGFIKNEPFGSMAGMNVGISFAQPSFTPSISVPTTSKNYLFNATIGQEIYGLHPNINVSGYVNTQYIAPADQIQRMPAYGYLYFEVANKNERALLDVNREKELQFNYKTTPHIAIPQYTYDVFSISGEGTGGTIRPYRGDVGYSRDHLMNTKSTSNNLGIEVGVGNGFHGGNTFDNVTSITQNSGWTAQNDLLSKINFSNSDSNYQSVYFRNPAEKTSNTLEYYRMIGGDSLIRVKLNDASLQQVRASSAFVTYSNNSVPTGMLPVSQALVKKERDKRSQVVTYLTAAEAEKYGLEKKIFSLPVNSLPGLNCNEEKEAIDRVDGLVRKSHHLSEIDILNPDGRRYIYGLPAYNIEQTDVTFSVNKEGNISNIDSGLVAYDSAIDNSTSNNKGKENYFNAEKTPAYAHSFLLTGILSPDYVDIKGDGITEDDLGDGIKFNYSRVYGPQQGYFEWRTPGSKNKASYNEGLKTYSRDDKASYFFGKKEVWYVHSVESKTMVALFKISADRKDIVAAASNNGGYNVNKPLRKLERIELYTKADLAKFGASARPVKTVYFEYNYELCKGFYGNPAEGKLTLKKIWFSYNGNEKGKQNPYLFTYSNKNPNYHPKRYDRWGNYKDQQLNPGGLNNADYPYAVQDSTIAAQNASAWHLTEIKLPSAGRMKISYESDDYAFVQNKRATQMMTIEGFGNAPGQSPTNLLYAGPENEYIFFQSPVTLTSRKDVFQKYLEGSDYVFLKVAVNMPADKWGSGWELVPVYGKIADYGIQGTNRFWIRFEKVNGISPILRSAMQYLKNNLSSKAYPNSELDDEFNIGQAVSMLASVSKEIKNVVNGFETEAKKKNWCNTTELNKSFARLNQPLYKKLGGGHRVKRIEIFDNWNAMTGQRESRYGQEYQYQTSIEKDGKKLVISSGVASYEPMIGNDENPFRQPIAYAEQLAPMAPVSFLYSEMPLGESYFPGATVGYSKVRVRTINTKAKSSNGWQETEFYTTKDFPTEVNYTMLDGDAKKRYKPELINLLKIYSVDRITVSQGFKVELNDMNGKMKSTSTYAENDSLNPISYSVNYYRETSVNGERKLNNNVWVVDSLNGKVNTSGVIGTDIELITDFRQQTTKTLAQGISPNVDAFFVGPFLIPIPSLIKIPQYDESQFRSAATVKIVQRYGILDSIVVMDKGSIVTTKNFVYDGETGDAVLSRTNNEFNDPIYNFNYPAHWAFSGMGPAYKNIDVRLKDLRIIEGKMYNNNGTEFATGKYFESGDEILVSGIEDLTKTSAAGSCPEYRANSETIVPNKIWALDLSKTQNGGKGIVFIDKIGKPYTAIKVSLRIFRSGKRNMLDASVGSVMAMENPVRNVGGINRIVLDNTTKVINASATSYKDLWRVDNSLFQKDSCYTKIDTVYLQNVTPVSSMLLRKYSKDANPTQPITPAANILNDPHFTAGLHNFRNCNNAIEINCKRTRTYRVKSIIRFDYSQIPSNAKIISAGLNLDSYQIKGIWQNNDGDNLSWNAFTRAHYAQGGNLGGRTNASKIRNVTTNWNQGTPYDNVTVGAAVVNVPSSLNGTCDDKSLNVLPLIKEAVLSPLNQYGFMIELSSDAHANKDEELRTMSFYSGNGSVPNPDPKLNPDPCLTANAPTLNISYSYAKDTCVQLCRYNIADSTTNPYRWGILGNWRMDRAYTYYSDRLGSTLTSSQTDVRREGAIQDFAPYWSFTQASLKSSLDTTRWVWNSAMANFNRKGFETENYDPLGRYNAGLYGYEQTLPVAVAQNSKSREILSDGFEDYQYQTKNCISCATPREFDFLKGNPGTQLDSSQSHTGKYSIRVNAGAVSKTILSVSTIAQDTASTYLLASIDSVPVYSGGFTVAGLGNGLTGNYTGWSNNAGCPRTDRSIGVDAVRVDPQMNFNLNSSGPFPNWCPQEFGVEWVGFIQPKYSDYYTFYATADDYISVTINNQVLINEQSPGSEMTSYTVYLQAGQLYPIDVYYQNGPDPFAQVSVSWSSMNFQSKEIIPQQQLYTNTALANGSLVPAVSGYCKSLKNIRGVNVLRQGVSPIQSSRMVFSAWVNIDGADCLTTPVPDGTVVASFNKGAPANITLVKTGVRIEGWQRYEADVVVPGTATQITINLNGAGGRSLLFDDVRMQPYNSNMKSFVYDPVSLRLMAELDENNYSTFYEYDDDGTLIRVKKETERGIMTIKETRSALIKEN